MVLSAWAAIPGTTAGLGKWLEARQIFTSIAWEKKKNKKILLFLETQSFPNNRHFLQLQILAVERPPLTASALAPDLALADPTPKQRLLLSCPHVPSKQPCYRLPSLTHGPAGPSSPAPLNILFTCPAPKPGCITN